ncbi:hypothetical protein B1757_02815 [Acidithiobacillus marinus]|uniref:HD/PDEase domain-containing protein n=1 Tax=Acidithiobacillus marinus TaxID=187490 RepID=A0A2I1DPG6_9PROT|nr:HD domain-containing protein [Acidithiobacillus marinus]PKY11739.1 hypothetical protein B1757_02815 [Acidithiobacillus marinus]
MAVPVHRRLLSATATVLGFWALVATVVTFFFFSKVFSQSFLFMGDRIVWVIACTLAATAFILFWEAAETFTITQGLRPQSRRGLSTTTLGMLPQSHGITGPRQPIPIKQRASKLEAAIARLEREKAESLLDKHALKHFALTPSPRSELFWSIYGIIEESGLPASPFHGSHGDASLLEHSLRVAAAMARVWADMESSGITAVRASEKASSRSFDLETAILAGFAHDLGKVLCFRRVGKNGENIEVIGLHDIEGSRMLARLEAFWALLDPQGQHDDFTQRMLTQSIRYYHHAYAYPGSGFKRNYIQTDEAVVDLMQAIRKADLVAGSIEGREDEIANDYQDSNDLPEQKLEDQVWESFQYLISRTNLINHKSPEQRLGYKQGNLIFLAEKKIRAQICAHLGLTRSDYVSDNNGNPGPIIKIITAHLDELGILKKDFQQKSCKKPEGAGFYLQIEGTTRDGEAKEVEEKIPYYLARIEGSPLFSRFTELEDYRSRLAVLAPTWPQYFKAIGKEDKEQPAAEDHSSIAVPEPVSEDRPDADTDAPQEAMNRDVAQDAAPGNEAEETAEDDDDRDAPPDESGDLWGSVETASPADSEAASEPPAKPSVDPESASDPEPEPEPEPAESGQSVQADQDRAEQVPRAERLPRAERQQAMEAARKRAEQNHNVTQMIKGNMQTPAQRANAVSQRLREMMNTYPGILEDFPEKTRKRVLFSMVWLDEIQRDLRARNIPKSAMYRGNIAELLDQEPPGEAKTLVVDTLSALDAGLIPVLEARMMLQIVKDSDGCLDMVSSGFTAPLPPGDPLITASAQETNSG